MGKSINQLIRDYLEQLSGKANADEYAKESDCRISLKETPGARSSTGGNCTSGHERAGFFRHYSSFTPMMHRHLRNSHVGSVQSLFLAYDRKVSAERLMAGVKDWNHAGRP